MTVRVVGIDPGPTPGIVVLEVMGERLVERDIVQCSASALYDVLAGLRAHLATVAVERFVARGRMTSEQRLTAEQADNLARLYPEAQLRNAGQVKPWATEARLEAAGLLQLCKGMRHARDAARHALYAAVHGGRLPDPLSKEWVR